MTANESKPTRLEVHIRVAEDDDAIRISGVLEALGYSVVRQLGAGEAQARLRWAIERLTRRYRLTAREAEVLGGVLDGFGNDGLAGKLEISRATVKWHMHNLFCKCGVNNREALLRLALQLPGAAGKEQDPHHAEPDDPTRKIERQDE